jgi:gliding motility-associated-like protein
MKKIAALLSCILMATPFCLSNFSATGGSNGLPYAVTPVTSSGLNKVFVFQDMSNARLTYSTSNPSDWTWYSYEQNPSTSTALSSADIQTGTSETTLSNVVSDHGYFVESSSGVREYCYVIGYSPVTISDIVFTDEGDACTDLVLKVNANIDDLVFYTTGGLPRTLDREFTLSWNSQEWNSEDKRWNIKTMTTSTTRSLDINWSIGEPPLCDTYFTVSGDQYATYFGTPVSYTSSLYSAVSVKNGALAVPVERDASNELEKVTGGEYVSGSAISGPAPLTIDFYSYPSDAVLFYEWFFYDTEDGSGTYKRYSDENLSHTFLSSGKFLVKLYVSNSTCKDSAQFTVQVSESKLECPNYFTPRSTPGENDEFRVAYRSLVKFKGTIVNRWGNVLFEWSDPAKGWDGTYKGKAVSPGVYFYLIEAKGSDGLEYKRSGDINLLE